MAIDVLQDRSLTALNDKLNAQKTAAKASSSVQSADDEASAQSTSDNVVLTSQAQSLQKAVSAAMESDGVDVSKVEKLKQAINDGTYEINYESIASRMIEEEAELGSII